MSGVVTNSWISVNQTKNYFSCSDLSWVSIPKENDEKMMIFDVLIETQSKHKNLGTSRTIFFRISQKPPPRFSWNPSVVDINTWSTSPVDFSTHNRYMDKPSWSLINREKVRKILGQNEFVTTPVPFYYNFPENHDFDDLVKTVMTRGWIWCVQTIRGDE